MAISNQTNEDLNKPATKGDLFGLGNQQQTAMQVIRTELKTEIQNVKSGLKTEIQAVRTELKTEIQDVRTELKTEIQDVRTELKTEIQDVKAEIKSDIQLVKRDLSLEITKLNIKWDRVTDELLDEFKHMKNEILTSNDFVAARYKHFIDEQESMNVNYHRLDDRLDLVERRSLIDIIAWVKKAAQKIGVDFQLSSK